MEKECCDLRLLMRNGLISKIYELNNSIEKQKTTSKMNKGPKYKGPADYMKM